MKLAGNVPTVAPPLVPVLLEAFLPIHQSSRLFVRLITSMISPRLNEMSSCCCASKSNEARTCDSAACACACVEYPAIPEAEPEAVVGGEEPSKSGEGLLVDEEDRYGLGDDDAAAASEAPNKFGGGVVLLLPRTRFQMSLAELVRLWYSGRRGLLLLLLSASSSLGRP